MSHDVWIIMSITSTPCPSVFVWLSNSNKQVTNIYLLQTLLHQLHTLCCCISLYVPCSRSPKLPLNGSLCALYIVFITASVNQEGADFLVSVINWCLFVMRVVTKWRRTLQPGPAHHSLMSPSHVIVNFHQPLEELWQANYEVRPPSPPLHPLRLTHQPLLSLSFSLLIMCSYRETYVFSLLKETAGVLWGGDPGAGWQLQLH